MKDVLESAQAWSGNAAGYDQYIRQLLTPFSEEAVRWAGLGAEDDVLDVAAGPGTTTLLCAPQVRSVQALDFADEMIAALRRHTADLANVSATVGNGQDLPYEDGSFSAAFSMFGLMFFPDPVAGLREIHRVLRPGGQVFIGSWVAMADSPMMAPTGAAMQHVAPPDPDVPPPPPLAFDSAASLTEGLRAGGFTDIEVRRCAPQVATPSAEDYWATMGAGIMMDVVRDKAGDAWPDMEARILEHLRGTLEGVESLEMPAWIGRGVRG